jgi:hypothetical protein
MVAMGADEYREFARQQQVRFERLMRDHALRFERFIAEWRAESLRRHEEVMARFDEQREESKRAREDNKAHTDALLALLDRLNGDGSEPAT